MENLIKRVVIVGGGTAGWCAAAALSNALKGLLEITLVESDSIGTIGVGEATIPPMRSFNNIAGLDEQEFLSQTSGTFKLGIRFENWLREGHTYFHAFGNLPKASWVTGFQHVLFHANSLGKTTDLSDYFVELRAAQSHKCYFDSQNPLSYAYHLDATAYARWLRTICIKRGVSRVEGMVADVARNSIGDIESLLLDDGSKIDGDFFIDCTGLRAFLIEKTLGVGFEDWSEYLPVDRAWAVQIKETAEPAPYTTSTARSAGWQWHIPLQHRTGTGLVYSSRFQTDEDARCELLQNLTGVPLAEPRLVKFRTGRRLKQWHKNVLSLGLSSGFLEPLESTSIYLMMIGITRFIQHFPFMGVQPSQVDYFNAIAKAEMESIRDFIILHYTLTEKRDTQFWQYMGESVMPQSLQDKIQLFKETGHIYPDVHDIFKEYSWLQVLLGQGLVPETYHPVARLISHQELYVTLDKIKGQVMNKVDGMPSHSDFLKQYCPRAAHADVM